MNHESLARLAESQMRFASAALHWAEAISSTEDASQVPGLRLRLLACRRSRPRLNALANYGTGLEASLPRASSFHAVEGFYAE